MTKNVIITGLILVVVGMLYAYLTKSVPPVNTGNLTIEQEDELRADLITAEGRGDSLQRELDKNKALGKVAQEAFKSEIRSKVKTIAELKARPAVIQLVAATPALDSLHKAYDSAMVSYEDRIASLSNELQMRDKINLQVKHNFQDRLEKTEQLLSESQAENSELKNQNRKLKRGRVLRNVLIPVALGAGIWLGLQADR